MKWGVLIGILLAAPACAETAPPAVRVIGQLAATSSGQPLVPPPGPLQATLSETTLPPGGGLPPHKHPYLRYAYVLSGRLRLINLDTARTYEVKVGDFVADPIGQWHEAQVVGDQPVHLLIIDQTPPGAPASIRRDP